MTVSNIGAPATPTIQPTSTPPAPPARTAKNDHDGDDAGSAAAVASPAQGQGTRIDTKA
jgi:hypothetical protein